MTPKKRLKFEGYKPLEIASESGVI
jgi:hypothetical protein